MKKFLFLSLVMGFGSAFAKDCQQTAYRAAKAVDSISNSTALSKYSLQSTQILKRVRSGGESLETIEVNMVVGEDMASIWEVEVYNAACVIKSVRFVTGD